MNTLNKRIHGTNAARAAEILRELGFGIHETAIILALNRLGSSTVGSLSDATGIHQANLYNVLDGLMNRGLVVQIKKRPKTFDFAPLGHLRDLLMGKIDQLIMSLEQIQNEGDSRIEVPALIYTLKGNTDVQAKIISMIGNANKEILLVVPDINEMNPAITDALHKASKRKVRIRIVHSGKPLKLGFRVAQRIKKQVMGVDLVVDRSVALLAMPDLSICGWADIPMIAYQLQEFLEQTWKLSREVKK